MRDPILDKWAELLVDYCTEVREGDDVIVRVASPAMALARPLVRSILRRGGVPHLRVSYPEYVLDVLELAPDSFFDAHPDLEMAEITRAQAWISVRAELNKRELEGVDRRRMSRFQRRERPVLDHRVDHTRWVGTIFPTASLAQDAGMSTDAFERFALGAMYLYEDDPIARWRDVQAYQARLVERLSQAREVRLVGDGTDLTLSVAGRSWVNSAGKTNMPSGEVFTGPVEDSANGTIRFQVPSSVQGSLVEDVRMAFEGGRVVDARAARGQDLLEAQLSTDDGARYLGEIGIGTNYEIRVPTLNTLYDEKIGGTVHLALGKSYRETGGVNESAIHWDLIADLRSGGAIYLDGDLFQENGEFRL